MSKVVAETVSATNAGTTEAVIVTTPTVTGAPAGGAGYLVSGELYFTGNAVASTVTITVRQGANTTTGTSIGNTGAMTVAAGAVVNRSFGFVDKTAAATGVANYTVTMTASAALGAAGAVTGFVRVDPIVTAES